ncbi:MAG: hypothetical protein JXA25_20015 [Anaerolineales bacterium]|nr:hypothetical protein [Anaerolineales bacterium]
MPAFFDTGSENVSPRDFFDGLTYDFDIFKEYAIANSISATTAFYFQNKRVGNAVDLCNKMFQVACDTTSQPVDVAALFTTFNLDADRGYLNKCWEGTFRYLRNQSQNANINYVLAVESQAYA